MYSVVLMAALTTGVDLPDLGRRGGCHGCRGGCYGCWGGCYGCWGGCHGCWGGCHGCWGGCHGCWGGCWGCWGGCYGCYGCFGGCFGGCYGGIPYGGYGHGGGMVMPGTARPGGEKAPRPKEKKEESMVPAPATIVVELPPDAKLLIDNEATTSKGGSRLFQSPILNPGKEYQYTLKAEVVRDGKPIKAEQVVTVRAGQTTPVTLTLPTLGIAQR
jgi:uncharacterized protein (TIGR03000 family)